MKKKFVIFLLLLFSGYLQSQIKFHNLTIKDGFPTNRINFCLKDSKGFIWFATDYGICRYDGIRNTVFSSNKKNNYGLTENTFTYIFEKNNDELCFISFNGFLFSYKYSKGVFENLSIIKPALKNINLSYIYKESENKYWIAANVGLIQTDSVFSERKEFLIPENFNGLDVSNKIQTIYQDKKGIFWLGMFSRSISRFNPVTGKFSFRELSHFLPPLQQVNSIIAGSDNNYVFVSTAGEGIYKININNFTFENWRFQENNPNSIPSDRITSLVLQNDSILWAGTIEGLARINLNTNKIIRYLNNPENPYSLVNNIVHKLYLDSQNILWVSTFGGISKLYTSQNRFTKISQKLNSTNTIRSNIVNHCLEDKFGNLWIATSKGIDIREANTNRYFHYNLPKSFQHHRNEEIVKFFVDDNTWWIGTWGGGISRFIMPQNFRPDYKLSFTNFFHDPNNIKSLSSNFIRSFAKDKEGNLWITTWNGGLNKIDLSEKNKAEITFNKFISNGDNSNCVASNFVDNLLFDNENDLWISTSQGLQHINFEKNNYEMVFSDPQNLTAPINRVTNILKENQDNIWFGTFGGLVKIDKSKKPNYSIEIIYNDIEKAICSITQDKTGTLWFSTFNSEIGSYNPRTKTLEYFSMLHEVDGFDFYLGDATLDRLGRIYFTGKSGFLFFDPNRIQKNQTVPPIYITSISQNGEEINPNTDISLIKSIELDYNERNLSLSFAALNYFNPENNEYKYNLEGYSKNWISLGKRTEIDFVNLPSGNYKLKIIGSNNDGIWNNTGINLSINISPPFWENNYYRILFSAFVLFSIYMIVNSKLKKLKTEKLRQNQFSKQLMESQEEERKRLSQELHDSLGQNLLVIKNQIDLYKSSEVKDETELVEISNLIKESISEVKEISSNLHPHQLERLGLIKAVKAMVNKIAASANIEIDTKLDDLTGFFSPEAEINIYRIIQESLNNILKHSGSDKAIVEIKKEKEIIHLVVEDFGKGFDINDTDTQNKFTEGLGLKSMKERVRLLNGEIKIDSSPNTGTKISITIKIN